MLNLVAVQIMNYMLAGPLHDKTADSVGGLIPQTRLLPESSWLPILKDGTQLHLGVLVARAGRRRRLRAALADELRVPAPRRRAVARRRDVCGHAGRAHDDARAHAERRAVRHGRRDARLREHLAPDGHRREPDRLHRVRGLQRDRRCAVRRAEPALDDPLVVRLRRPARRRRRHAGGDERAVRPHRRAERPRRRVRRLGRVPAPPPTCAGGDAVRRAARAVAASASSSPSPPGGRHERVLHGGDPDRDGRVGDPARGAVPARLARRDARTAQRRAQPRRRRDHAARRVHELLRRARDRQPAPRRARRDRRRRRGRARDRVHQRDAARGAGDQRHRRLPVRARAHLAAVPEARRDADSRSTSRGRSRFRT